jgi:hypothetical protein
MPGIRARVAHRWRRHGLLGALQPIDVLFELSASVRFPYVRGWSGYPPKLSVTADVPARQPSARNGHRDSTLDSLFQSLEPEVVQAGRCEAKERPAFFDNRDLYRR